MTQRKLKQNLLDNRNDLEALRELKSRPKNSFVTIPTGVSEKESDRILREPISE